MSSRSARSRAAPSQRGRPDPRRAAKDRTPGRLRIPLHAARDAGEHEARVATRLGWLVVALFAAALAIVAFGFHHVGDYGTETDFYGGYADGARALHQGRVDPSRYGVVGPGYEAALALVGLAVPDLFRAAELISVVSATAALALWLVLVRRRGDARLALFTGLVLATNAQFFRYGYAAATDALALALQAGSLCLLLAAPGRRAALAAGLVAAAAFLTRYNAIVLLPVGVLAAWFGGRMASGDGSAATRRREALAFAAGFAVPVAAWLGFSLAHGVGFASQLYHNLAYEVFARARGIPWDAYQRDLQPTFHSLGDVIARDPIAVFRQLAVNLGGHLAADARELLGWPVAICTALGLLFAARGGWRSWWPLALAGLLAFLALVPVFHSERYSLAVLPFYALLAGAALASPRFAVPLGRVRLKTVLAMVPLVLALVASVAFQRRVMAQEAGEVLEVAETLKALARPGDRLIARKPHLAWLAGVRSVAFPFATTLEELAAYAHRAGARWLLYSSPETFERPWHRHLLDTTAAVPGLTVRRAAKLRPAVLYEIGPAFGQPPAWMSDSTLVLLYRTRARLLDTPRDVDLLGLAGAIELERGMLAAAREHLERAADLAPQNPHVLLALGETLLRAGDLPLADVAYQRVEQLVPGGAEARIGRGWVAAQGGRTQEAAEWWRPVIGFADGRTLARMIEVFHEAGDGAAVAEAERALENARR